jgi:NAD(P)-dependent dehydrogenase (short-subunit alcohol dehydrogenase family)
MVSYPSGLAAKHVSTRTARTLNAIDPVGRAGGHLHTVPWLVSEESPYVTGVTLPVDAGSLIKQPLSQLCKEE